jgi:hypothetical protein
MMAQNIRKPNSNSHEEYTTHKSKYIGAKHTETDHHCLKKCVDFTNAEKQKLFLKLLANFKTQNTVLCKVAR